MSIPMVGIHSGFGDQWLKIGGIKLFADGMPQTKTAWLHGEYPDGGNGSLVLPGATEKERYEELVSMIVFAHKHGFQCGIHAIGDRAIESCIDGFLKAKQEDPRELRHYLVHCDMISDADIKRVAANNIGVSTQPILKWVFSDAIDKAVGVERSERQFPLRSLLDAGVHVSLSSDAPVTDPDWLQGVEAAVLRKSKASGTVRGPEQRITAREAIRLFTMGGAWQDHMERRKGSLEPGKLADFCVLDQDIFSAAAEDIHAITNVGTVVGGKVVYDAGLEALGARADTARHVATPGVRNGLCQAPMLLYATAVASSSIISSGMARRVTPSSVDDGLHPAAFRRTPTVGTASRNAGTSVT